MHTDLLILRVAQFGHLQDQPPRCVLFGRFLKQFNQLGSSDWGLSQVLKNDLLHRLLLEPFKFFDNFVHVIIRVVIWLLGLWNFLFDSLLRCRSRSFGWLFDRQSISSEFVHELNKFRLLNHSITIYIQRLHAKFQVCWCYLLIRKPIFDSCLQFINSQNTVTVSVCRLKRLLRRYSLLEKCKLDSCHYLTLCFLI